MATPDFRFTIVENNASNPNKLQLVYTVDPPRLKSVGRINSLYEMHDLMSKSMEILAPYKTDCLTTSDGIEFLNDKYLYYFEYTVKPKRGDQIFEIDWDDHSIAPTDISSLTLVDKYSIMRIHDYRLEDGNVQYYITSTEFDEIRY